jgi:hypothetical protein
MEVVDMKPEVMISVVLVLLTELIFQSVTVKMDTMKSQPVMIVNNVT